MTTSKELLKHITTYYTISAPAYMNWGADYDREGVYALHCGFHPQEETIDNHQAVKRMTGKIIDLSKIIEGQRILDSGCGTGSVTFEIASLFPSCEVHGINITTNQIAEAYQFKLKHKIRNVYFSYQDYIMTGFKNDSFDRVIFCESLAHAHDKKLLITEVARILKREGRIVISDVLLAKRNLTNQQIDHVQTIAKGWYVPNFVHIEDFEGTILKTGFVGLEIQDITVNIMPSVTLASEHAKLRLDQNPQVNDVITRSRKACTSIHRLMKEGVLKYFFITANLTRGDIP